MENTLARLQEIFRDTFQDGDLQISPEMIADEVDGWDSLMHVTLVVNVEAAFKIRFTSMEVATLKNVGEFAELIQRRSEA